MKSKTPSVVSSKGKLADVKDNALLIGFFKDNLNLEGELKDFDTSINSVISSYIKDNKFEGDKCQTANIYVNKNVKNVILAGLGEKKDYNMEVLLKTIGDISRKIRDFGAGTFTVYLDSFNNGALSENEITDKIALGCVMGLYTFNEYKTKDKDKLKFIEKVAILTDKEVSDQIDKTLIVADAVNKTRDLINCPPNIAVPEYVADYAKKLVEGTKIKCTIFDENQIEKLKMGCLLGVAKASVNKPRFLILEYNGKDDKERPLVLVGKGVTFDTGGLNVKPYPHMNNMKDDMGGATAVIHAIYACEKLKLPLNLTAIAPLCENSIDGTAYRPDDILTAYNKMTVEVKHTDAEGRLILADALAYAAEMKPAAIIDVATLTGASLVVLGSVGFPYFSNDSELGQKIKKASEKSLEKSWEMPLWPEYEKKIKGDVADINNLSDDREAGSAIGAVFLKNFVDDCKWAHLDIGSTVLSNTEKGLFIKGATGTSVRLLIELAKAWK
jgi:leucyl aminopeptidase